MGITPSARPHSQPCAFPRAGYGAAKHPAAAEYSQNQGNYLEILLCPAMSLEKSSLRKGFGLKFGFVLGYPLDWAASPNRH